ncbi:MAG: AAA family ATPase [Desulfobacteraceae bacterium]|nr:AAA family ATPase [Desulfobacteraceae bacterium]
MYRNHFGLTELPFSIAPDPRFLYMSAKHREGLAHLLFGLQSDCGFVLLTGEVGTGKTTVCRCLLEQIPADTDIAFILNPKVTVAELLATICEELHIQVAPGSSNKVLIDRINAYLLENHARGRRTVLIADEAQVLDTEVLEQLRLLTNLETSQRKLLQILLIGQPELRDKLARPELRQLAQRITARYHLEPLSREEIGAYVAHRLEVAGGRRTLFPPSCLKTINAMSGGVPRLINVLCDRALLGAYVEGREKVDRKVLRQAGREVFGPGQRKRRGLVLLAALGGGAVLAAALLFLWTRHGLAGKEAAKAVPHSPPGAAASAAAPVAAGTEAVSRGWPPADSGAMTREAAFRHLFAAWGIPYDGEKDGEACRFAVSRGLRCLEQNGGWEALRRFNEPAVLQLGEGDRRFFAALTGVDGETALLTAGAATSRVRVSDLGAAWQGEFVLLWRPPPVYRHSIRPGESEPLVSWLADRLARIDGQGPGAGGDLYDGQMAQRVKAFQLKAGLDPDGVVGPRTLIHINTAAGMQVPRLATDYRGIGAPGRLLPHFRKRSQVPEMRESGL